MDGSTEMKIANKILKKVFPDILDFRDIQLSSINKIMEKRNALCLMPTGMGKSLIYQVAGLINGNVTIVMSPLIALMGQQVKYLNDRNIKAISLSDFSAAKAYDELRKFRFGVEPAFIFLSPERAAFDGYLEYVLRRERKNIGLVVVDEAHCVSHWGYTFRPAYAGIPHFLNRIFGEQGWPPILCLTATLNPKDRREIQETFQINQNGVSESQSLLRNNLRLGSEIFDNETAKKERLYQLLKKHQGEKIIVYVHRKISKKYGTRALEEEFSLRGFRSRAFDGDMDAQERSEIVDGFIKGDVDVVFATSAFGMGIDIPDIRVVIHYLLPESIEQYYQEVGRAGRDGKIAHGYLLYTPINAKVREDLIRKSVPDQGNIIKIFDKKFSIENNAILSIHPWSDFSEENNELVIWHYLLKHNVVKIIAKGPGRLTYFEPVKGKACPEIERYGGVSKTGLILAIANKLKMPITRIISDIYNAYHEKRLRAIRVPEKLVFFESKKEIGSVTLDKIESEIKERVESRLEGFRQLREFIEKKLSPEKVICEYLGI